MGPNRPSMYEAARMVVMWAGELGIDVHQASRFPTYVRVFNQPRSGTVIDHDHPRWSDAQRSLHDVTEMHFILQQFYSRRKTEELIAWLPVIDRAMKDPSAIDDPKTNSPGRDHQWELLVAACAIARGFKVTYKEPDLLVDPGDGPWAIACKRIKTMKTLSQHIRKAIDQVYLSGIRGFVAADMTIATNEKDDPLDVGLSETDANRMMSTFLKAIIDTHRDVLFQANSSTWCAGLVLNVSMRMTIGPKREWGLRSFHTAVPWAADNKGRRRAFTNFTNALFMALPQSKYINPDRDPAMYERASRAFKQARRNRYR